MSTPHTLVTMQDFMRGETYPPNLREMALEQVADIIAGSAYYSYERGRFPRGKGKSGTYAAAYFLKHTQGGAYDGEGLIIVSTATGPEAWSFAVCNHERVAGPGAIPIRGWRPGYCKKCGLNMTVDSSD